MATPVTASPVSALRSISPDLPITLSAAPTNTVASSDAPESPTNPVLQTFVSGDIDELLDSVTGYIEGRISDSEDTLSPASAPALVQEAHSRQIEVCLSRFRAAKVPGVSVREYLRRLHFHCPFSAPKLLALVHYLTVLDVLYLDIAKVLRSTTVHRLILAAVVVATKVLDDRIYPQRRFSIVGGIELHQLLGLELAFFFLLNGKCWLTDRELIQAGEFLRGTVCAKDTLLTLSDSKDADIIWSNVGNRQIREPTDSAA